MLRIASYVLIGSLLPSLVIGADNSPQPGKRPQVETQQETKGATNGKDDGKKQDRTAQHPPVFVQVMQPQDSAEESQRKKEKAAEEASEFWSMFSHRVKITDSLLAFFTFILVLIGAWQGVQLKLTVDAARNEFISTHRPKIRIKHLWLKEPLESGKPIIVNLVVVNHGNTEARHIQGEIATSIVPSIDYLPAKPTFPGIQVFGVQPNAIPSGMTIEFTELSDGRTLTDNDVNAVKGGGSKLYCFGYVDYQDTSGRIRKTTFCRVLKLLPLIPSEKGRFVKPPNRNTDYEYED